MFEMPAKCPVCGNALMITRLHCSHCDTIIEGHFHTPQNPFTQLTNEQQQFLLAFVRCEGRFTRLEEELKLSYPTLRNRLADIIRAMGFEPGREEVPAKLTPEERKQILEDLGEGKITLEEAQKMLRGKESE
jgi:hypothetical protein